MPVMKIDGIDVDFPYKPYESQTKYMSMVIRCLKQVRVGFVPIWQHRAQGQHGVLESPTGTGKTLCLLCATLGWLRHRKKTVDSKLQGAVSAFLLK